MMNAGLDTLLEAGLLCPLTGEALRKAEPGEGDGLRRVRVESNDGRVRGDAISGPELVTLSGRVGYAVDARHRVPIVQPTEAFIAIDDDRPALSLDNPKWAEAYDEMEHYTEHGFSEAENFAGSDYGPHLIRIRDAKPDPAAFPAPYDLWLDCVHEYEAERDAYEFLAPMSGERALQIGGMGLHSLKFALAGASLAVLLTPMMGEAAYFLTAAEHLGVADRVMAIIGVAECLPFASKSFGRVYSGGCLHHTRLGPTGEEIARVLSSGGRFSAVEPNRAPLYELGIRVLGKRERNVNCVPLDRARVSEMRAAFPDVRVRGYAPFARYAFLGLEKLGIGAPDSVVIGTSKAATRLARPLHVADRWGSAVSLCGAVRDS
jgi:hypothetical protein